MHWKQADKNKQPNDSPTIYFPLKVSIRKIMALGRNRTSTIFDQPGSLQKPPLDLNLL